MELLKQAEGFEELQQRALSGEELRWLEELKEEEQKEAADTDEQQKALRLLEDQVATLKVALGAKDQPAVETAVRLSPRRLNWTRKAQECMQSQAATQQEARQAEVQGLQEVAAQGAELAAAQRPAGWWVAEAQR